MIKYLTNYLWFIKYGILLDEKVNGDTTKQLFNFNLYAAYKCICFVNWTQMFNLTTRYYLIAWVSKSRQFSPILDIKDINI